MRGQVSAQLYELFFLAWSLLKGLLRFPLIAVGLLSR
jgi:hypothetical protein